MKRKKTALFFLLAVILLNASKVAAQPTGQLPPFSMTLASGQYFNGNQVAKGKPVLLVYFDPDCDHCHTMMNDYFARPADFKAAEVLMITFKPLNEIRTFAQAYKTHLYPNIKVGTEGSTYFLRNYYKMQNTPFVVLYNKEGKPVARYQKDVPLEALLKQLKKI
jgi:cytochrome oxidase Cu insertion factor (SCO1/SenC/PrrC family)